MIPLLLVVAAAGASDGTVTLPLEKFTELTATEERGVAPPPVGAVVSAQRLSARGTADGLDLDGHFTVDVLADGAWSKVCVLKVDPGTQVVELPRLDHATLAPMGGELCLLSKTPGSYSFDVKLTVRGQKLAAGRDALWSTVEFEGESVPQASGTWTLLRKRKVVVEERPPLEPSCWVARAQLVSTVEGHAQLSVAYHLKLDREQPLSFAAPAGWKVERIAVNGVPRKGGLDLVVAPGRDTDAVVELQLSRDLGIFHLSGRLDFELPKASWPVAQVDANVHLPAVFEYRRTGGSLEPAEAAAESPKLPGKMMSFRQHLVASSSPSIELEYSVDLRDRYFKTRN